MTLEEGLGLETVAVVGSGVWIVGTGLGSGAAQGLYSDYLSLSFTSDGDSDLVLADGADVSSPKVPLNLIEASSFGAG